MFYINTLLLYYSYGNTTHIWTIQWTVSNFPWLAFFLFFQCALPFLFATFYMRLRCIPKSALQHLKINLKMFRCSIDLTFPTPLLPLPCSSLYLPGLHGAQLTAGSVLTTTPDSPSLCTMMAVHGLYPLPSSLDLVFAL